MQETLNSKKKGDVAFRHKDFRAAIECYTQVKMVNHLFLIFINYFSFHKAAFKNRTQGAVKIFFSCFIMITFLFTSVWKLNAWLLNPFHILPFGWFYIKIISGEVTF